MVATLNGKFITLEKTLKAVEKITKVAMALDGKGQRLIEALEKLTTTQEKGVAAMHEADFVVKFNKFPSGEGLAMHSGVCLADKLMVLDEDLKGDVKTVRAHCPKSVPIA
jgi:hypothetical protein